MLFRSFKTRQIHPFWNNIFIFFPEKGIKVRLPIDGDIVSSVYAMGGEIIALTRKWDPKNGF